MMNAARKQIPSKLKNFRAVLTRHAEQPIEQSKEYRIAKMQAESNETVARIEAEAKVKAVQVEGEFGKSKSVIETAGRVFVGFAIAYMGFQMRSQIMGKKPSDQKETADESSPKLGR